MPLYDTPDANAGGGASAPDASAPDTAGPETIRVATYNVRNLDASDARRFENLARVLTRVDADVLGIVEVHTIEAAELLRDAIESAGGPRYPYVRHREGLGESPGIALLSAFPPVHDVSRPVNIEHRCADGTVLDGGFPEARPIVEAGLDTDRDGESDLTIFINHWRSRVGAPRCESAEHRFRSGRQLRALMEARADERPGETLVALGDFNAYEFEPPMSDALGARVPPGEISTPSDRWLTWGDEERLHDRTRNSNDWNAVSNSTYNFDGLWSRLDHVVLSGDALLGSGSWSYVDDSTRVIVEAWMLFDGRRPYAFDPNSGEGFSDHLPVRIELRRGLRRELRRGLRRGLRRDQAE